MGYTASDVNKFSRGLILTVAKRLKNQKRKGFKTGTRQPVNVYPVGLDLDAAIADYFIALRDSKQL